MKTPVLFYCFLILSASVLFSQSNQKVYSLINEWKMDDAYNELEKQLKSHPDLESYLLKFFIMEFQGRITDDLPLSDVIMKSSNPNPYLYALWYEAPLIGYDFPKKERQLKLLKDIASDEASFSINLYSSANYALSLNSFFLRKERKKSRIYSKKTGILTNWQFVGPFYNLLETENNKILEPLTNPKADKDFDTEYYGKVHWFTPKYFVYDGWISMLYYLPMKKNNIGYAQTFVFVPEDKDVYLTLGYSGTVKLWLNDALLFEDNEEKRTDYDAYVFKCRLAKGYNRILIQEGIESIEYPYFAIRLLDENFKIVNYKTSAEYQPYTSTKNIQVTILPHFAEDFFNKKIESDPNNMLNYILLSRAYIRKKDSYNALRIIDEAIKKFGENPLLVYSKTIIYSKDDNKVLRNEMLEKIKMHKECNTYLIYDLNFYDLYNQEKYSEALEILERKYKNLSIPLDEDYYSHKIEILLKQGQAKEALNLVDDAYAKFPYSIDIVTYKYNIEKKLNKNLKKAISYLEKYDNYLYNYKVRSQLVEDYFNNNEKNKSMNMLYDDFNWNELEYDCYSNLVNVLYQRGEYEKSLQMVNNIIESQPFFANHYEDKGLILMSLKRNEEAIESFKKALSYNCNLFDVRNYLYDLKQEKKIENYVPEIDENKYIKKYLKQLDAKDDYFYIIDDKIDIFYPEGGSEQIQKYVIKILSKNGIDRFKEATVPYNENTQVLNIEEAFLYKSDGRKLKGEINQNEIIWPDLKEQDIIYVKYRIKNYFIGKFSKNFHQRYSFSSFTPDKVQRKVIIAPKSKQVYYKYTGKDAEKYINFTKDSLNEFYIYSWQTDSCEVVGDENYMPSIKDIGKILYVSTLNSWKEIADWYHELIDSKISDDYEVTEVYNSLFNKEEKLGAIEKARRIYNYITQNINYINGTVFQHRIIPQKSSATIRRKLGDCKDLTVLFVSLANMAGLKSNVVLVNTRDNGNIISPLPLFDFDHAMVKFYDENNNEYFCELTNPFIPFGYLPANNFQAITLTVPNKKFPHNNYSPELMNPPTRKKDKIFSKTKISIKEADMNIHYHITWFGSATEYPKSNFANLSDELLRSKIISYIEKKLPVNFSINLEDFKLSPLEKTLDSVSLEVNFTLNNQVKRLGNSSVFTIPFMEAIYNSNIIKEENRKYDIDYYRYEEIDEYNNTIEITIADNKKWTDWPTDLVCKFNNSTYSITYKKLSNNKIEVKRRCMIDRTNIKPDKYPEFKAYVIKILEKENSFISFQ